MTRTILFVIFALLTFYCMIAAALSLYAYDTYIFRIKVNQITKVSTIKTVFSGKGTTDDNQTFFNTYVFPQADTNYVLVKITPRNDTEQAQVSTTFGLSNVDIWKQIHLVEGLEPQIIDNSQTFPVNRDWMVKTSS